MFKAALEGRFQGIVAPRTVSRRVAAMLGVCGLALAMPAWGQAAGDDAPPADGVRNPLKPKADDKGDAVVKVSEHMTVDLHVKDEDLINVLELLSMQSQRNIVASKGVGGKVSAQLYNVTFYEALDSILNPNGYAYIENGNFIYVYTFEELEKIRVATAKLVTRVFRLNYLNAEDAKGFVEPLMSERGTIQTNKPTTQFTISDDTPVGADEYALAAVLVVIDYEENLAAVEAVLNELDQRPQQVLIEATILQASLNEANAFGTDFSIIADLDFTDFIDIGGARNAAGSLIEGGSGASGQGLSPSDNQGTAISSTPGNTSGPGTFKVGVIADDISIFIRALDEVTDTTIISNPKLLALNRMPTRVQVGRKVGYLQTTSTDTATTQTVEFLDTGTQLYFRPFVSSTGEIRMEIKPKVSEAIIREATDATGAAVSIPDEVTQEVVTNVIVRDGQTIVLGGLFRESTTFTRRQVPILGDIPIIGTAFRGKEDTTQRAEIIFLITPSIVTDAFLEEGGRRGAADVERVRAGTRQGLLPWSQTRMTSALNLEAERLARRGEYDKALWCLQRSLSQNPIQPDALRLRERITGERERWPSKSMLQEMVRDELEQELRTIPPAPAPAKHRTPYGATDVPRYGTDGKMILSTTEEANNVIAARERAEEKAAQTAASPGTRTNPQANGSFNNKRSTSTPPSSPTNRPGTSQPRVASDPGANRTNSGASSGGSNTNAHSQASASRSNSVPNVKMTPYEIAREMLPGLRAAIAVFQTSNNGNLPDLGKNPNNPWAPLLQAGLLQSPPANPLISGRSATNVLVSSSPEDRFNPLYGWVFNPKTGELWASGLTPTDKPVAGLSDVSGRTFGAYSERFIGRNTKAPGSVAGANENGQE